MWAARDEDGTLYIYEEKPYKNIHVWNCDELEYFPIIELLPEVKWEDMENLLPEVKWEDEEPTEVELIIKKK